MRSEVIIYAKPQGKERPRFTRQGIAYTPKKTRDFEKKVREEYIRQNGERYKDKPVAVKLEFGYKIPSSASKITKECMLDGLMHPCVRPDIDNVAKAICDALNSVAYDDDKQICKLEISKVYSKNEYIKIVIDDLEIS